MRLARPRRAIYDSHVEVTVRHASVVIALLLTVAPLAGGTSTPQDPQQPPIKTGVDLVQIDVSVLDRSGNPVRGLTADDFVLLENGKPQQIRGFLPVAIPPPLPATAPWVRDIGPDVVANSQEPRRLVVIMMDDGMTRADAGESKLAVTVARAVVDQLGPADLAAVVFTYLGRAQNFTADRRELHAAIDSFAPRSSSAAGPPLGCVLRRGGCVVAALQSVATFLGAAPPGRKLLVYVGASPNLPIRPDADEPVSVVTDMFRALQRANVEVDAFDAGGLRTFGATAADRTLKDSRDRISIARQEQDNLRSLADNTGGRAIADTNAPDAAVADVFRRNSAYYLLGFQSSDPKADGRYRKIEVRVNRPDVEVRSRSGYYAAKPPDSKKKADPTGIEATLAHGLPSPDLPVQVHTAVLPAPGRREAAVVVTTGLQQSSDPSAEHVSVLTAVFDSRWTESGRHSQSFDLAARPGNAGTGRYDVHSRFFLRPGRYEVRVAIESRGRHGSAIKSIEVPDFADQDLSLSSVLIDRRPAAALQADAVKDIVSIVPTSARVFARSDRAAMFVRVHQGGKKPATPVVLAMRVVDARNAVAFEGRSELGSGEFDTARSADHRLDLPLDRLAPGEYLLQVTATAGDRTASRDARFTVR
jgi:VWFA-related protein